MPSQNLLRTPNDIKTAYADWFDTRINQFVKTHKGRFETASLYKARNGFFITISFNQNRQPNNDPAKYELDIFNELYNRVCREVIGRNYHRKSFDDQRPLAIGCLDANGSRYWKSMGEIENKHIHSIWIFTNQTAIEFQKFLSDENRLTAIKERFGIRQIDIQPLDHENRNLTGESRISSYTAKFIGHNNDKLTISDDFRVFPL